LGLELEKVNITTEEDWNALEKEWDGYFDHEYSFTPYKDLLSKLNIIVGFGRGFWGGAHGYFYLVYHTETKNYYWYLRNIESDKDVYFYKVDDKADIFALLRTKSIKGNFDEFDNELDFNTLYPLSIGEQTNLPEYLTPVPLTDIFGEDTEQLRIALMYFRPGEYGSRYPHLEFHERFFLPVYQNELDKTVQAYNQGPFHVFREENQLLIQLNNDIYELKKRS
jgi:hypothetical protein